MNTREASLRVAAQLKSARIPDPAFEAELLVRLAGDFDRTAYFGRPELTCEATDRLETYLAQRLTRMPYAYIAGHREFCGLDFEVTPAVLIPRPETELLVEMAGAIVALGEARRVADIGTGSGCIAVSFANQHPEVAIVATDSSAAALRVARSNALRHGAKVEFVRADLARPLTSVDLVVANLPYIPERRIKLLEPEVRDWEPAAALSGGEDGLELISALICDCASRLRPRYLLLEVELGQAAAVVTFGQSAGATVSIRKDLAGIERVVRLQWP